MSGLRGSDSIVMTLSSIKRLRVITGKGGLRGGIMLKPFVLKCITVVRHVHARLRVGGVNLTGNPMHANTTTPRNAICTPSPKEFEHLGVSTTAFLDSKGVPQVVSEKQMNETSRETNE